LYRETVAKRLDAQRPAIRRSLASALDCLSRLIIKIAETVRLNAIGEDGKQQMPQQMARGSLVP